ncbi:MAG: transporter ATP-binding protein, partial [Alphaproteobacteria bacterium]|nr:transporter ATP-binding protein [Alphaproteobacteria bacterium]
MLAPPLLELRELTRRYTVGSETIFALNQVDLAVEANDYMAIVGSSGSGKSTMMNILGCLDQPTSGEYLLDSTLVSGL